MADIFELGQLRGAHEVDRGKKTGLEPELKADIIIFPGVRYDREDVDRNQPMDKKRALHKPKAP